MSPLSRSKVLPFSDFEALCEKGQVYSGLVEGLGKVSWESELIYFVWIDPTTIGQSGYYQQVSYTESLICQMNHFKVVTKTKYNMHVVSPEQLEYTDPIAYQAYYPVPPLKRDAIKESIPDIGIPSNSEGKSSKPIGWEIGAEVDKKIGLPLGIADKFSSGKTFGRIGTGLTVISIVNDIYDGKFFSAFGTAIKSFSGWYGIAWDAGVMIYESERFIINNYWSTLHEYKRRSAAYERSGSNRTYNLMRSALKNYDAAYIRYEKLMQKKYGPYWYKRKF